MIAERGDEIGGERYCIAVFEQERESITELDDETGAKLARELDFDEAGDGTFQRPRWAGVGTGHGLQFNRLEELRQWVDFRTITYIHIIAKI